MPAIHTLLLFVAAAAVLVAIPGPNHIYIVTRSLGQGPRAGIASAMGVETGTLVHIAAAAVGLSALIASSTVAFSVVKYLGAAYLLFLGIRALLRDEPLEVADGGPRHRLARVYADGILVNVLNPKVALFFLAFLPQFVDPSRGDVALQIVTLGLVLATLGLASDVLYALGAGAIGARLRRHPAIHARRRFATGAVYIALGVTAALSGDRRS